MEPKGLTRMASRSTFLAPLKCPGGPRMSAAGVKNLFNVPHAGLLAKNDFRFILNLKLTHQLVAHLDRSSPQTSDRLTVELGPGAGALTRSLLTRQENYKGVFGIEVDARYNALLQQIEDQSRGKFRWTNADILQIDEFEVITKAYPELAAFDQHLRSQPRNRREELLKSRREAQGQRGGGFEADLWACTEAPVEIVSNLPFSVSTELLLRYSVDCGEKIGLFRFGRVPIHCFVQKEIAERLTASPNSPQFSRLSVLSQNYFHVHVRQTFTEKTFYPRLEENVLGALVSLIPRAAPLVDVRPSTLVEFNDIVLRPGCRAKSLATVLQKCVPLEVATYMLGEAKLDGSILPVQLTTIEVAKLALLWESFLKATNQSIQHKRDRANNKNSRDSATDSFDWSKEERYARKFRSTA